MKIFIILFLVQSLNSLQIIPKFTPNGLRRFSNGTNFTSLLVLKDAIYVGAKDNVYKLDANNIENINSPLFAQVNLPVNNEQKEQCLSTYFDEVINF